MERETRGVAGVHGGVVHEGVLENMDAGAMLVDIHGGIVTCNRAAGEILGIPYGELMGRNFGEAMVTLEGMDALTEVILDTIFEREPLGARQVEVMSGERRRALRVNTSYLRSDETEAGRVGVIAVFSDVTELEERRESEARLARKVEEQYTALQGAYREIEESNKALGDAMRRGRVVRAVVGAVALAVVAGGLWHAWESGEIPGATVAEAAPAAALPAGPVETVTVAPERLVTAVAVPGRLKPLRETSIVSPVDGTVTKILFEYGDSVEEGQLLVEIDISEMRREYRGLRAKSIDTAKRVAELEDWENSDAMVAARRALDRARRALEKQKHKINETSFLLEKGVIPATEHESALERNENLKLDLDAALRELDNVREKGGPGPLEAARIEHENLIDRMRRMETAMANAEVRAPLSGVVMQPPRGFGGFGGGGEDSGPIVEGKPVKQGKFLVGIADIRGLSVTGLVDEAEIVKMRVGQPVAVTSDAFPGVRLPGKLSNVSSQAASALSGGPAQFEVTAALERPDPEVRARLRLGMSADLRIVIQDRPDVLMLPFTAVRGRGAGAGSVRVFDRETGAVREVEVRTGATTLESVEIVSGLSAGDEVVLSGGGAGASG